MGDAVPGEEYERFLAFGDELGFLDSDTQKQKLKLYEQELSAEIAKLRQEAPGKQKLCRGLGIYGDFCLPFWYFEHSRREERRNQWRSVLFLK